MEEDKTTKYLVFRFATTDIEKAFFRELVEHTLESPDQDFCIIAYNDGIIRVNDAANETQYKIRDICDSMFCSQTTGQLITQVIKTRKLSSLSNIYYAEAFNNDCNRYAFKGKLLDSHRFQELLIPRLMAVISSPPSQPAPSIIDKASELEKAMAVQDFLKLREEVAALHAIITRTHDAMAISCHGLVK